MLRAGLLLLLVASAAFAETRIGLRMHVPNDLAGAPLADAAFIERQLAMANHHFALIGVTFEVVAIEPLVASAARVETRAERTSFARLTKGRVIDVFITGYLDDVDAPGEMRFGVAWRVNQHKKLVILSTQSPDRVLAHELGHVFGLPHSTYDISIMNKAQRDLPPVEERTFHPDEVAKMKAQLRALLRARTLENLAATR